MIPERVDTRALATKDLLATAASFARATGLAISVVLPREPGVVGQAQAAAEEAAVTATAVIQAHTVCVRFAAR